MNLSQAATAAFVIGLFQVASAQDDLIQSIQRLGAMHKTDATFEPAEYMSASGQALRDWSAASQEDRTRFSSKMFLVHFRRAEILASSGDFEAAAEELKAEALLQSDFGGRLEYATKRSDTFFERLIQLQAQLTAETGSDPLAGRVGYSFEKDGEGFTAARLELGDDIAGITVPEIGADETLVLVHRLNRQGGRFVATPSRWLVVPKGRLPDVLKQATREVAFDSSGKMMVHRLQAQGESSPKANPPAANNTQAPSFVQPPAPKKALEAKPATPSEEPTSSTPWSVVAVLIVTATGLLWLVLKKRK
jgi:hypothetical protein